jgi:poly(3-hydroxybutyrate) depolymerase
MTGSETPSRMPDVIFILGLIDNLEESYNIDKTRIYVNEMSNSGGMAFVLFCKLSDRIAAGWFRPDLTRNGAGARTIDRCR